MDREEGLTTLVVGLGHRARQGKNYIASQVRQRLWGHQIEAEIYSFGAALKAWLRVEGFMHAKDGPLLQFVGTEMFRHRRDPNVWVRALHDQIAEEQPQVALVADVRFPNELAWVHDHGFSVKIERFHPDSSPYYAPDRSPNHESEAALEYANFTFTRRATSGDVLALMLSAEFIVSQVRLRLAKAKGEI